MGLAISRSIIEAHAGRIWATCNPDRGLTIHCELPCVPLLSRDPGPKESGRHDPVRYT